MRIKEYVSAYGHNKVLFYFDQYDPILFPFQDKKIRLLEIGVFKGASLKMWEVCFPLAEIIGLDINPECRQYERERVKIIIGEQEDKELLKGLGRFDLVIDDGGHFPSQQVVSFEVLFDNLNGGGWYFIEDIQGGYHAHSDFTTKEFFTEIVGCTVCSHLNKYKVSEVRFINDFVAIRKTNG